MRSPVSDLIEHVAGSGESHTKIIKRYASVLWVSGIGKERGYSNPRSNRSVALTSADMMHDHGFTKKSETWDLQILQSFCLPHTLCFSGYICGRCIPLRKPAAKCRRLRTRFLGQHAFRRFF